MSLKRLLALVVLAGAAATVLVAAAPAGGIRDWEPCPDVGGKLTCPPGTEGVPYSIKFRAVEEPPCAPGEDTWHIINGTSPPGLSLGSDGTLSGTPTQAGAYAFWVEMRLPDNDHCNGTADTSQEEFFVTINPGVPRLIIGPESAPPGTVNSAYSLQMTASLPDPKTWAIVDGALPPGLALGATDGLIAGMPTLEGTYTFTVRAALADQRADTKVLGIAVRAPLVIAGEELPAEVGVRFLLPLSASGGTGTFTWSLTSGTLPAGLTLGPTGTIAGIPTRAGSFAFTATVADNEGRTAVYEGALEVAARLKVATRRLKPARRGFYYEAQLRASGGVEPLIWRIKRGPLPRGIAFDRDRGLFYGTPTRARTYRIAVEARDGLRVRGATTVVLVVKQVRTLKRKR